MQLAPPTTPRPAPRDVAAALAAAREDLGHRPAVTVLRPDRRDEQGVASLAQWAAKGAHLLELDLLLEPGDRLRLDVPVGWTAAAVVLAAWWAGIHVTLDGDAPAAVVQEGRRPPANADDVLWTGDAVDGGPLADVPGEPWVQAVQTFPDQPPPPRAAPDRPALSWGDRTWTQAELLTAAGSLVGEGGTLGLDGDGLPPELAVAAVAVRPLLVGRPTVVLAGASREEAAGERVGDWY